MLIMAYYLPIELRFRYVSLVCKTSYFTGRLYPYMPYSISLLVVKLIRYDKYFLYTKTDRFNIDNKSKGNI